MTDPSIAKDIEAVARLSSVPTILQVVMRTTGMRFSAVARVTDSTWTACAVSDEIDFGLKVGGELTLETTICNEIRQHRQPVVFGHASAHPVFSTHSTPKMYGFESYISIPILRADGSFWGTLCAIDPRPAKLEDPNTVKTLELFAQLIASQLDADERQMRNETALLGAQETAKLREQFIAVLGHDLRNPLNAINLSAEILQGMTTESRTASIVANIKRSCTRMNQMIQDILDFARGRLGAGIPVNLKSTDDLRAELAHVIAEVRTIHPGCKIDATLNFSRPIRCDGPRLCQLLANLLTNAVVHGAQGESVRVVASENDAAFELSVTNTGRGIDADKASGLFQPFTRSAAPNEGLGLGLYIASEIAKAHGGLLSAISSEQEITFRFVLPWNHRD